MLHAHVHAGCSCPCWMPMSTACPCLCCMCMLHAMLHVHVRAACPFPCCMSMSMLLIHVYAEGSCLFSRLVGLQLFVRDGPTEPLHTTVACLMAKITEVMKISLLRDTVANTASGSGTTSWLWCKLAAIFLNKTILQVAVQITSKFGINILKTNCFTAFFYRKIVNGVNLLFSPCIRKNSEFEAKKKPCSWLIRRLATPGKTKNLIQVCLLALLLLVRQSVEVLPV